MLWNNQKNWSIPSESDTFEINLIIFSISEYDIARFCRFRRITSALAVELSEASYFKYASSLSITATSTLADSSTSSRFLQINNGHIQPCGTNWVGTRNHEKCFSYLSTGRVSWTSYNLLCSRSQCSPSTDITDSARRRAWSFSADTAK